MNQTPKPIGRPTFRIDGRRLRDLRKEAGLSQLTLAEKVYAQAGKTSASPEVLKNSAQRWESTGAIPPAMATHLAEVLNTTVGILQGALPEPAPSKTDEIERRLRQRIVESPSPKLIEALALCEDSENPTRALAKLISSRLEAAQLSQSQEEFQDLAGITGYSMKELQEPTSFEGFWMLIGTGTLGLARTEILIGVGEVLLVVTAEMQSCLESWNDSDAHVSFAEKRNWFRVTINFPRLPQLTRTLRFVRCQPRESGLQWSSPTWRDRYWVDSLVTDAYNFANFVTGFDAVCVPADCKNLRFAIARNLTVKEAEEQGPDAMGETVALTAGNLADLPEWTLESHRREGHSHDLIVSQLTAGLWETLLPLMAEWPLECWTFRSAQSRIDLILDVPYRLYATSKSPLHFGNRFSVTLVETKSDGGQRRAPWRQKSVNYVHERLMKCLLEARQDRATPAQQHAAS